MKLSNIQGRNLIYQGLLDKNLKWAKPNPGAARLLKKLPLLFQKALLNSLPPKTEIVYEFLSFIDSKHPWGQSFKFWWPWL